ncbi:hypothetical protein [Rhodoferax koreensis]|nr:hypothetical protein [Rhodoferax koreense]
MGETTADVATAEFNLAKLDVKSIGAIAEIAAEMRCKLVPRCGGPALVPTTAALLLDLARRAAQNVCPSSTTLFDDACAKKPGLRDSELVWNLERMSIDQAKYASQ